MVKKRRQKGLECNNGIRNRGLKEQLQLGSKRAFNKTVRDSWTGGSETSGRVFHQDVENE
jgi:hypothetical protein